MNKNRVYNIRIFVIYLALRAWRRWGEAEKKNEKNREKTFKISIIGIMRKNKTSIWNIFLPIFSTELMFVEPMIGLTEPNKKNYTHMIICTIFKKKNFSLIFTLFFIAVIWWGVRFGRWRHRIISWTFDLFNSWKM